MDGVVKILDSESGKIFTDTVTKFASAVYEELLKGSDFTIKLEVQGNVGKMKHCRVDANSFHRPKERQN